MTIIGLNLSFKEEICFCIGIYYATFYLDKLICFLSLEVVLYPNADQTEHI